MKSIPLKWKTNTIFFSQIDWADTCFGITYGRSLSSLIQSIRIIGLQNPVVLQEKDQGLFRIVSGARRLRALQEIGQESIGCRIASAEIAQKELLLWNVHDNLDRGFNQVEQALAVKKLVECFDEKELIQDYLPLLNLPPKKEVLQRVLRTSEISPIFQKALLQGRLFPETIESAQMDFFPCTNLILALFVSLHWGFQKQKEFLADLQEISRRKGQDSELILLSEPIVEIWQRQHFTPKQKGDALRNYFRTCLYPTLTETEKVLTGRLASLNLDHRTKVSPPPFFEGGRYNLEIIFSNSKELRESLERIITALEEGKLDALP